jgi:Lrp/AsnC family transcriptional regulator, regulator for asnA, asnC and gidA
MAQTPRGGPAAPVVLDDISKRIIEQLQVDGRQSYAAIGKAADGGGVGGARVSGGVE